MLGSGTTLGWALADLEFLHSFGHTPPTLVVFPFCQDDVGLYRDRTTVRQQELLCLRA